MMTTRRTFSALALALFSQSYPAFAQTGGVLVPKPQAPAPAAAPFELTSSDGAGLELVSVKVRGVVEDPLAFTELHLRFMNPENRVREGRFRITLPSGATISRFAMKINGNWMEGEVVERQAARRAYEDFLHRRQDPALLENEAGNEFSARVFPIPPRAEKELIVSYSQELVKSEGPYRLPLVGLPKLRDLDIRVMVSRSGSAKAATSLGGAVTRQEVVEVQRQDWKPDQDLVVDRQGRGAGDRVGLRHENLAVARVMPLPGESTAGAALPSLLVLFDTSASRALGFAEQVRQFDALMAALRRTADFDLHVIVFDQELQSFYRGRASGWGEDDGKRLLDRRAEGASDLAGALAALGSARDKAYSGERLLIVSDGVRTAGASEGDVLRERVKGLAAIGVKRVDVLAVGGIRDDAALGALARGGVERDGMVLDAETDSAELAMRLRLATRSGLKVQVPGARWVWPEKLDGVQPGDEFLIYADLPADKPLVVTVGNQRLIDEQKHKVAKVERPLLERAWVKARLDRLALQRDEVAAGDPDLRAALTKQMIELSTKHRVLCDYTALLVLETEGDYQRFGIDRRSLANIMVVGANGIEVLNRKQAAVVVAPPVTKPDVIRQPSRDEGGRMGKGDGSATRSRAARPERAKREQAANQLDDLLGGAAPAAAPPPAQAAPVVEMAKSVAEEAERDEAPADRRLAAPSAPPPPTAARSNAGPRGGGSVAGSSAGAALERQRRVLAPEPAPAPRPSAPAPLSGPPALSGELAAIMKKLNNGQKKEAFTQALAWRLRDPGDVLAIVALGETLRALGRAAEAARVFGSIIDLFPSRTDLRRFVAGHLEQLGGEAARALAVDCLRKAAEQRPDHPSSHHLLAMALLKTGDAAGAFAAIEVGLSQQYPGGRFAGTDRILREDLGLAAAAWRAREPGRSKDIEQRLQNAGVQSESERSLRFVLSWETDANDVDFHIQDSRGGHAYYSSPQLPSGGELYADVTTGYGPECFTVRGPARAAPYRLTAHYYSRGPMGYGMGRIEAIEHDGRGHLSFDTRPFVVMNDQAFVNLGTFKPRAGGDKPALRVGQVLAPVK